MAKYYKSSKSVWQEEKSAHEQIDTGLEVLLAIDRRLENAFEELNNDRYGMIEGNYYHSIRGNIMECKTRNQDLVYYARNIHERIETIENDFCKEISKALEALSKLDINDYEIENTLDIETTRREVEYETVDGVTTSKVKTIQVRKDKITYSDVQMKTDMVGLKGQWAEYLEITEKDKKKKLSSTEIEKLKEEFYKERLMTSFEHQVYNDDWWSITSNTLDYIPIVGGLKSLIEGCIGQTMTGEELSANERIQYRLMGVVSAGLDIFTFGVATAAVQGTKTGFKIAGAIAKYTFIDVSIGWGSSLGMEALYDMKLPPEMVFLTHIGVAIAVGKKSSIERVENLAKEMGMKPQEVKDLMKYVGSNISEFEKIVKKGNLDDILKGASGAGNLVDDIITDGSHYVDGKLKPNSTYKSGEHDYIYKTNEDGLISKAHTDDLKLKTHDGRLKHNAKTPGKIDGDHAGHLFGDRFGGSPELDNLVSQAKEVNLSKYKIIENDWADALKEGKSVSVDISVDYIKGTSRPISFSVSYTIDGEDFFEFITN